MVVGPGLKSGALDLKFKALFHLVFSFCSLKGCLSGNGLAAGNSEFEAFVELPNRSLDDSGVECYQGIQTSAGMLESVILTMSSGLLILRFSSQCHLRMQFLKRQMSQEVNSMSGAHL